MSTERVEGPLEEGGDNAIVVLDKKVKLSPIVGREE